MLAKCICLFSLMYMFSSAQRLRHRQVSGGANWCVDCNQRRTGVRWIVSCHIPRGKVI